MIIAPQVPRQQNSPVKKSDFDFYIRERQQGKVTDMSAEGNTVMGNTCHTTLSTDVDEESTIAAWRAREEAMERRKSEMRDRVEAQLTRAEEEGKRLAQVWEELEVLSDPMRKEVAGVRKRIDLANRELKSLGQICQKKEKEYKDAMESLQEKNNEKSQLTNTLAELLSQSEKLRMTKLEELSNIVSSKQT